MVQPDPLSVRLDRLDGRQAVLQPRDPDQPTLRVSKQQLPTGSAVGDEFVVIITPAADDQAHRDAVARKLLEDILNGR